VALVKVRFSIGLISHNVNMRTIPLEIFNYSTTELGEQLQDKEFLSLTCKTAILPGYSHIGHYFVILFHDQSC